MDRVVEGNIDGDTCWEGGGILTQVELPVIGSSQAIVLEDAQTLDFSDVSKSS